jgi:hypothetical protein
MPFVVGEALLGGFGVIVVCVHHLADTALRKCYYMSFNDSRTGKEELEKDETYQTMQVMHYS